MSIKFLVLGGEGGILGFGGGSADFIFMGARIFLKERTCGKNSGFSKHAFREVPSEGLHPQGGVASLINLRRRRLTKLIREFPAVRGLLDPP